MRAAVRGSALPVMLLQVADRCIVDVSDPVVALLGTARDELMGHDVGEFIDELAGSGESLGLVATGAIDGYRRFQRTYKRPDGATLTADVWLSAYSAPPRTHAVAVVLPSDPSLLAEWDPAAGSSDPLMAVGTVDAEWRVDRISADVELMFGYRADAVLGAPFLGFLHPGDVQSLIAAIRHAAAGPGGASLRIRLRAADDRWQTCRAIITPLPEVDPLAFGFALTAAIDDVARPVELVDQLRIVARELTAAGVTAALTAVPAVRAPMLAALSSRELEIVTSIAAGDRVPLIARSMFLGESTVRNHLTSVYRKLGVSSQQELITLLRTAREVER